MNYIHTHSDFSNLRSYDSIIKVEKMPEIVRKKGSTAVFLTDHEHVGGHFRLLNAAKKIQEKDENFKAILGNEIYVVRDDLDAETFEKGEKLSHLLLLAKNREGWEALNELSTSAWENSFHKNLVRVPTKRSKLEKVLKKNKGNIIMTTACLGGIIGQLVLNFHKDRTEENKQAVIDEIVWLKSLVGEDDFYLEVQPATYADQKNYNSWLVAFAKATNSNLVVATDAHYVEKEDFEVHNAFLNSQDQFQKHRETSDFYKFTYYMEEAEVRKLLLQCPNFDESLVSECINNTLKIADKCENYYPSSPTYLMETLEREDGWEEWMNENIGRFNVESQTMAKSEYEIDRYFVYQLMKTFDEKLAKGWIDKEATLNRLDEEVSTILKISEKLGERLSKYFIVMKEMLKKIWEVSLVGVGRGSAGSSIVAFLFDITSANPLTTIPGEELPFWRFLHESRPEIADIDVDSSSALKEEIFKTLSEWAAENNNTLAKVSTFGTLKSKVSLQVAARGLGYQPEEGLYLSSLIPIERGFPKSITETLEEVDLAKEAYKEYSEVFDMALRIEGLVVSMGQHAAAITFINNDNKYSHSGLVRQPGNVYTTAYDLNDLESNCGLLKFDMLQTKAIDAMQTTLNLLVEEGLIEWQGSLKETYDKYLHPSVIDVDDKEVWDKICRQEILGLFQLMCS